MTDNLADVRAKRDQIAAQLAAIDDATDQCDTFIAEFLREQYQTLDDIIDDAEN